MAQAISASVSASSYTPHDRDKRLLDLRRMVVETEEAIAKSRALIRTSRDSIELLERLHVRRASDFPFD
jgi:hypothetical protein